MEKAVKTIGVLTSGGDAPGMNAAVRAVVETGLYHGLRVLGIDRGYNGLINGNVMEMNSESVTHISRYGGTVLKTARCLEFKTKEGVQAAYEKAKELGIDGLVVIGGDGSFRGAKDLCEAGLPTIAIPGTIDNDISCSEYTIGYDTCLNTVVDAVDKLVDTSESHDRCAVVEVMGRNAGYIAINTAIACEADAFLIPEAERNLEEDVIKPIMEGKAKGRTTFLVVVAEGVGGVEDIAKEIEAKTGVESRASILGHIQRGGSPTVKDRVVASQMGAKAVEILLAGGSNRIIRIENGEVSDVDIQEGLAMKKILSPDLIKLAKMLTK